MADLESDPFVEHALNAIMCQVFYQYAPITAAIHTAKYCDFSARQTDFRELSYQAIPQNGISSLQDFYTPLDSTKQMEVIEITVGMAITAYLAYRLGKSN